MFLAEEKAVHSSVSSVEKCAEVENNKLCFT